MSTRLYKNLSKIEKNEIRTEALILFPGIMGIGYKKYEPFELWLIAHKKIICPSRRDIFSAGGSCNVIVSYNSYKDLPHVYGLAYELKKAIKLKINTIPKSILAAYWKIPESDIIDPYNKWKAIVLEKAKYQKNIDCVNFLSKF